MLTIGNLRRSMGQLAFMVNLHETKREITSARYIHLIATFFFETLPSSKSIKEKCLFNGSASLMIAPVLT